MAIKDLLWACPVCHQLESIAADGRCRSCGAAFTRGRGARIRGLTSAGAMELEPGEWLARLPWPDLDGEGREVPGGMPPSIRQAASVRMAIGDLPLRRGNDLLGFVERFGPPASGQLTLESEAVAFVPDTVGPGANGWRWALSDVTAISPASSAIQLKARGAPAASIRWPDGSLRLWEQRLQYCVRQAYARAGKGDVVEFQPHTRTR